MVNSVHEHKHIGLTLDKKLMFQSHVNEAIKKANIGIGVMKFMSKYVPRSTLETIYWRSQQHAFTLQSLSHDTNIHPYIPLPCHC